MGKIKKYVVLFFSLMLLTLLSAVIYYNNVLPDEYYVSEGKEPELLGFIETEYCFGSLYDNTVVDSNVSQAELKLLGLIPIKTVSIHEVNEPILIPCGTPFGIKMLTDGVVVIEVSSFETKHGVSSPAYDSGIRKGDIIKKVNDNYVGSNKDIEEIIADSNGSEITIEVLRDDEIKTVNVTPELCVADNSYRAGLWVRDSSAGIGTVTFYNPETKVFAGLGHPVCDVDTGEMLPLLKGEVVEVNINGIKKGKAGFPGELIGSFTSNVPIGTLKLNNSTGLYGSMLSVDSENKGLPLGLRHEVDIGKAYIYTTIEGDKPQKYEITIEKIDLKETDECKNMIIKVTDQELLEKTGGIVQGMSGSPIVQNDKLIGAVTHVFVNNPTKGYAIFADTMYNSSFSVLECDNAA